MPVFDNHVIFEMPQGLRAVSGPPDSSTRQDERLSRRLSEQGVEGPREAPAPHSDPRAGDIRPESIIWIFGTARTGSTWLSAMMGEMAENRLWREPLVGQLFGSFYERSITPNFKRPHFIFSDATRGVWLGGIRVFVLSALRARFSGEGDYLVIGEPNGSIGAPLLMEALPESRMVFLIRDPRDVAASTLDRNRKGGDAYKVRAQDPRKANAITNNLADQNPDRFIRIQAQRYVSNISKAKQAFDSHQGHKVLIKYEELRGNTLQTMKHLYSTLKIPVDERRLAEVVEKHSWENVPAEQKGPGKSNRKATPGGWREDLTPAQVEIVENVTAPLLKEFYSDRAADAEGGARS